MASDSLDPVDWLALRAQAHRMLDEALDFIEHIRSRRVWQPIPDTVRERFRVPLSPEPSGFASVHEQFLNCILPYATGNSHPGFEKWSYRRPAVDRIYAAVHDMLMQRADGRSS